MRISLSVVMVFVAVASARADEAVQPASAVAPAAARPSVQFEQRAIQPGDSVRQSIDVAMTVDTQIVQSGQVAHKSHDEIRRKQERVIDVLEAADGRATRFRATFPLSWRHSPTEGTANEGATQPIEGKTYFATRVGDELTITDEAGAAPPEAELKLVRESLENLGKPNPLATLLAGKRLSVGDKILVPRDLVKEIMGLGNQVGSVRRFEMTLVRLQLEGEGAGAKPQAVFDARIEIAPNEDSPLSMHIKGRMLLEPETCRLSRAGFSGPVGLSSIERTAGGIFQYSASGELTIATRSEYGRIR